MIGSGNLSGGSWHLDPEEYYTGNGGHKKYYHIVDSGADV